MSPTEWLNGNGVLPSTTTWMTPELVYPGSLFRFNVTLGGSVPPVKAISAREAQYPMAEEVLNPCSSGSSSAFCVSSVTLRQQHNPANTAINKIVTTWRIL